MNFSKYPREFENFPWASPSGKFQIPSDIFKFPPGSGNLCANSLEKTEFLTQISLWKSNFDHAKGQKTRFLVLENVALYLFRSCLGIILNLKYLPLSVFFTRKADISPLESKFRIILWPSNRAIFTIFWVKNTFYWNFVKLFRRCLVMSRPFL